MAIGTPVPFDSAKHKPQVWNTDTKEPEIVDPATMPWSGEVTDLTALAERVEAAEAAAGSAVEGVAAEAEARTAALEGKADAGATAEALAGKAESSAVEAAQEAANAASNLAATKIGPADYAEGSTLVKQAGVLVPLDLSLYPDATCWDVVTGAVLDPEQEFERVGVAVWRYDRAPTPVAVIEGVASCPYPVNPTVDPAMADITGLMSVTVDDSAVSSVEIAFPEPTDPDVLEAYQSGLMRNAVIVHYTATTGTLTVDIAAPVGDALPVYWADELAAVELSPNGQVLIEVTFFSGVGLARQAMLPAQYAPISVVDSKVTAGANVADLTGVLPTDLALVVGWHNTAITPVVGLNAFYTALTGDDITTGNYQAVTAERQHTIGHALTGVTGTFDPLGQSNAGVTGAIALRGVGGLVPGKVVSGNGVGTTIDWEPLTSLPPGAAVLIFTSITRTTAVLPDGVTAAVVRDGVTHANAIGYLLDVTSFDPESAALGGSYAWSYTAVALYPAPL